MYPIRCDRVKERVCNNKKIIKETAVNERLNEKNLERKYERKEPDKGPKN